MIVMGILCDQLAFDTLKFEILDNSSDRLFRENCALSVIEIPKLLPTNKINFLDQVAVIYRCVYRFANPLTDNNYRSLCFTFKVIER